MLYILYRGFKNYLNPLRGYVARLSIELIGKSWLQRYYNENIIEHRIQRSRRGFEKPDIIFKF